MRRWGSPCVTLILKPGNTLSSNRSHVTALFHVDALAFALALLFWSPRCTLLLSWLGLVIAFLPRPLPRPLPILLVFPLLALPIPIPILILIILAPFFLLIIIFAFALIEFLQIRPPAFVRYAPNGRWPLRVSGGEHDDRRRMPPGANARARRRRRTRNVPESRDGRRRRGGGRVIG